MGQLNVIQNIFRLDLAEPFSKVTDERLKKKQGPRQSTMEGVFDDAR